MILLIIFIACALLLIPFIVCDIKNELIEGICFVCGGIGLVVTLVCVPACITEQSSSLTQKCRDQWSAKYTGLEQRIENWESGDHTDAMLWSDVQKYNDKLINAKYWNDNIWVSWFNERACQEFETIDIPAYVTEEGK